MGDKKGEKSFWATMPGILTGIAGVITAIATLITVLYAVGILGSSSTPTPISQGQPADTPTLANTPVPPTETPVPPTGTATPTDIPVPPSPTRTATDTAAPPVVQVVRVQDPGKTHSRLGFFVGNNNYIIAFTDLGAPNVMAVTWTSDDRESQRQARIVKRGGFVPDEITLLQVTGGNLSQTAWQIRISRSLQLGESVERYIAAHDRTPGTVVDVDVPKEVTTVNESGETVNTTINNALITTALSAPGDAGAPVIDTDGKIVAVVYGGSQTQSISVPIEDIKLSFPEAFQ
jgi:hypothetical protein